MLRPYPNCNFGKLISSVIKRCSSTIQTSVDTNTGNEFQSAKPFNEIPGPKPLPIVGNLIDFFPGVGTYGKLDVMEVQKRLHYEYGDIVRVSKIPGRKDTVYVYDPESIEKVFRHEGPTPTRPNIESFEYYRKVLRKDKFKNAYGLSVQGQDWLDFRSKVNLPLMQPRVSKQYVSHIDEVVNDFICRIHLLRDNNGELPKDFRNEMHKWAMESIARIALDTRLGCLYADLKPDSEPQKVINAVHTIFEGFFKLDNQMSLWKYISTPLWIKYVKAIDYFTEVALKYVDEAIERMKNRSNEQNRELSILERFLHGNVDRISASVMAIDLFIGGIDTVVFSTVGLLYYLAKNPEKQQKLYEEVKDKVPKYGDQILTFHNLDGLSYMKACIKEALRLVPISVSNMRELPADVVLSNYIVPKGTLVIMCNGVIGKFEKYFYSPEEFIPERWLRNSTGKLENKIDPFIFLPFGFGPRMCIGRRLAQLEIEILMTRVLQNFRVEYEGHMEFKTELMHYPASPYNFKLIERK